MQNLAKLVTTLLLKPFQKWGLDFIGLVKLASRLLGNQYIIVATDYATKWGKHEHSQQHSCSNC
jgi:hypothetical protein